MLANVAIKLRAIFLYSKRNIFAYLVYLGWLLHKIHSTHVLAHTAQKVGY